MNLSLAELSDIESVLALHARNHVATMAEEDRKDGFVTTAFTQAQLRYLVEHEKGLFVAKRGDTVVAYIMAGSWEFWKAWPIFFYMMEQLPLTSFEGLQLDTQNSFQYGPVCVDVKERGSGLLEKLFAFAMTSLAQKYAVLVTFINVKNPRSLAAHTRKLGLVVDREFEFNNNRYYWLMRSTAFFARG